MTRRAKRIVPLAIAIGILGYSGCATRFSSRQPLDPDAPRTVERAVEVLRAEWLSESDQDWILRNPKGYVCAALHLPFGTGVRNEFGLWGRHPELLSSCGVAHPDNCSGIIFERLWEAVRRDADPDLVRQLDCQFQLIELVQVTYEGFYKLRIGEILEQVQRQINQQLAAIEPQSIPGCETVLALRPKGEPNLECWSRVEFSEDGGDPVTLGRFLGWISWRNGFSTRHSPPFIELPFHEVCSWPEAPAHFQPDSQ